MPEYYFDLETYPKGSRLSPNDEVLTIQFQRLSSKTGKPMGNLTILKAWESSEETILRRFYKIFRPTKPFEFIPIGMNLDYDLFVLHNRWRKIGIDISLKTLFYNHPRVDIKPMLVILNDGQFKGASLDRFTGRYSILEKLSQNGMKRKIIEQLSNISKKKQESSLSSIKCSKNEYLRLYK